MFNVQRGVGSGVAKRGIESQNDMGANRGYIDYGGGQYTTVKKGR